MNIKDFISSCADNKDKVEMPMLPDLDDNTTSVLRQECTCSECSWRMKILKVNKIELPKLRVGLFYYEKPGFKRVPLYSLRKVQNGPKTNSLV